MRANFPNFHTTCLICNPRQNLILINRKKSEKVKSVLHFLQGHCPFMVDARAVSESYFLWVWTDGWWWIFKLKIEHSGLWSNTKQHDNTIPVHVYCSSGASVSNTRCTLCIVELLFIILWSIVAIFTWNDLTMAMILSGKQIHFLTALYLMLWSMLNLLNYYLFLNSIVNWSKQWPCFPFKDCMLPTWVELFEIV